MEGRKEAISFDLDADQAKAIESLAGGRKVRLAGEVRDGRMVIDAFSFAREEFSRPLFLPVNAPFKTAQAVGG